MIAARVATARATRRFTDPSPPAADHTPMPDTSAPAPAWRRALRAIVLWFDTGAAPAGDGDPDRIDWLRVLPFIGLHLACLGVFWVSLITSLESLIWKMAAPPMDMVPAAGTVSATETVTLRKRLSATQNKRNITTSEGFSKIPTAFATIPW